MAIKPSHYEELLAEYSNQLAAIALLKQHRPYLEMVPSMRRSEESIITIPLPLVRVNQAERFQEHNAADYSQTRPRAKELVRLPCEVAIMMCDPEWKIKTGVEILVFIHRPQEDFSTLLGRWRQTQVWLDRGYEWLMPPRYEHILNEGAEAVHPLFITFDETPARIKRGLTGATLPFVNQSLGSVNEVEEAGEPETSSSLNLEE
ncbi:hypothetical protein H6F90_27310 [Trichocoleus sp. FACHB-591]|uniref:hypothetical protein n=1 Tax=unclassified Trichocoleus TaxID=2628910 RepID=UPI001688757C|nr:MULTISPECIES: hypothetical protein [unclassified Trichocoleus]MBD2098775.1 hypothetical protein [Trichocoleus sp. FACHB-591]MBD2121945.1 hypothetical protein [Trichocoleus sp. FACHB-262]